MTRVQIPAGAPGVLCYLFFIWFDYVFMPGFVLWVVRIRVEFLVISISGDAILPGRGFCGIGYF